MSGLTVLVDENADRWQRLGLRNKRNDLKLKSRVVSFIWRIAIS